MPYAWLITYEHKGKKGNDFSLKAPFNWLVEQREKYGEVVLLDNKELSVNSADAQRYDELIDINKDIKTEKEIRDEAVKKARADALKKARAAKKAKAVKENNGNTSSESKKPYGKLNI